MDEVSNGMKEIMSLNLLKVLKPLQEFMQNGHFQTLSMKKKFIKNLVLKQ